MTEKEPSLVIVDFIESIAEDEYKQLMIVSQVEGIIRGRWHTKRLEASTPREGRCAHCGTVKPTNKLYAIWLNDQGEPLSLNNISIRVARVMYCPECLPAAFPDRWRICELCGRHPVIIARRLCAECRTTENMVENRRVKSQNNRTSSLGLPSTLTLVEWKAILQAHNYKCVYCGEAFDAMDHVIPVSAGGGTTADNVVPSCQACNSRKGGGQCSA